MTTARQHSTRDLVDIFQRNVTDTSRILIWPYLYHRDVSMHIAGIHCLVSMVLHNIVNLFEWWISNYTCDKWLCIFPRSIQRLWQSGALGLWKKPFCNSPINRLLIAQCSLEYRKLCISNDLCSLSRQIMYWNNSANIDFLLKVSSQYYGRRFLYSSILVNFLFVLYSNPTNIQSSCVR